MNKSKLNLSQIKSYGAGLHKAEARTAAALATVPVREAALSIPQIQDRPSGDSRPLSLTHVVDLAESISVLGLIEPLSVDRSNRLLAGGHRLAALRLLELPPEQRREGIGRHVLRLPHSEIAADTWENKEADAQLDRLRALPQWTSPIPVHAMEVDATEDTALALAIEMAENDKRRDYSPQDVKHLIQRLNSAGYRFERGRPREGQKAGLPLLQAIVGKSERTLRRLMEENRPNGRLKDSPSPREVALTNTQKLASTLKQFQTQVTHLEVPPSEHERIHHWIEAGLHIIAELSPAKGA
jgi:ParB family transcriptional regulator, chromosome partitioning protein